MKKKVKFILAAGYLLTGGVFFYIGYFASTYNYNKYVLDRYERKSELHIRTEEYTPSCKELKNLNIPEIVKKGDDYFFVHTTEDYFRVFGINISPGKAPETYWWGAGRVEALKQACGK